MYIARYLVRFVCMLLSHVFTVLAQCKQNYHLFGICVEDDLLFVWFQKCGAVCACHYHHKSAGSSTTFGALFVSLNLVHSLWICCSYFIRLLPFFLFISLESAVCDCYSVELVIESLCCRRRRRCRGLRRWLWQFLHIVDVLEVGVYFCPLLWCSLVRLSMRARERVYCGGVYVVLRFQTQIFKHKLKWSCKIIWTIATTLFAPKLSAPSPN